MAEISIFEKGKLRKSGGGYPRFNGGKQLCPGGIFGGTLDKAFRKLF